MIKHHPAPHIRLIRTLFSLPVSAAIPVPCLEIVLANKPQMIAFVP